MTGQGERRAALKRGRQLAMGLKGQAARKQRTWCCDDSFATIGNAVREAGYLRQRQEIRPVLPTNGGERWW